MVEYKLADILIENSDRYRFSPDLYIRSGCPVIFTDEYPTGLMPAGTKFDFLTYFNSLSIGKWNTYCNVDNASIRFSFKGEAIIQYCYSKINGMGISQGCFSEEHLKSDDWQTFSFEYPETNAELIGFQIITISNSEVKNAAYFTRIEKSRIRQVHLALATTTFKKEEFVAHNVRQFKDEVRNFKESAESSLVETTTAINSTSMIVIDNGRTLDAKALEGDGVFIFANKNVGGAGGFARGMIEAQRLDDGTPVTHVLVMDDDISLSAESIRRTVRLLSLVSDEWVDAFVSGAMFSLVWQDTQVEDVGFARSNGKFGSVKATMNTFRDIPMNMRMLRNCTHNECELPHRQNMYAAFWYCAIPVMTIKRHGLPLPIFVRYDDVEYGLRCKPKIMTMNGICVWHEDFGDRYNPFYERYCSTRNALILQSASGVASDKKYLERLVKGNFKHELKKLNYGSAEIILDAFEDYISGPQSVMLEHCEDTLKRESAKAEKLVEIDSLIESQNDESLLEKMDPDNLDFEGYSRKLKDRPLPIKILDAMTWNGQRFTPKRFLNNKAAIKMHHPDKYPGRIIRNSTKILVVDKYEKNAALRKADKQRFQNLLNRYHALMKDYESRIDEIKGMWRQAFPEMTSETFWKKYLEID